MSDYKVPPCPCGYSPETLVPSKHPRFSDRKQLETDGGYGGHPTRGSSVPSPCDHATPASGGGAPLGFAGAQ